MNRIALWSVVGVLLVATAVWFGSSRANVPQAPVKDSEGTVAAPARPSGDVVIAHVNGEPVYQSEFNIALESLPQNARGIAATPAGRRLVTGELVKLKLLKQEAERMKLDRDPEIAIQIASAKDNILAASALEKIVRGTPEDPRAFYEKYKNQFRGTRVRQVMLSYQGSMVPPKPGAERLPEAEAMTKAGAIVARLRKGEDFAAVAKAESDDERSAKVGGDLGLVRAGQMGDTLESAIDKLAVNEVSSPVRSPYGIHIFQVTGREISKFEEVEKAIVEQGPNLRAQIVVNAIKESAKVDLEDDFFKEKIN